MERVLALVVLGGVALAPHALVHAQSEQAPAVNPSLKTNNRAVDIPAPPKGKSTIEGGAIRSVDHVRDQFLLDVYGQKPMKVLYDARTQVFRDGKPIPLRDLGPAQHASVQTTLDGAQIFAITVHILGEAPEGDFQGRVVSFDPATGRLTMSASNGGEPFTVQVSQDTSIKRQGQSSFTSGQSGTTDLVKGSLVALTFAADSKGKGIARQITILATPGASFVFSGNITALDLHAGSLVLVDPRDERTYQIAFDTHAGNVQDLRNGQHVRVSADYDGSRYVATQIAPE